jgi:riboflavin synthase
VRRVRPEFTVAADFDLAGTRIGDSIAVNGACLTVVTSGRQRFTADVSPETLSKTAFGTAKIGQRVNLERALRLSDRLDGHLVSGHIDGLGRLESRETCRHAIFLTLRRGTGADRYMIVKGSVAVDGVSLTINHCDDRWFSGEHHPAYGRDHHLGQKARSAMRFNIETD